MKIACDCGKTYRVKAEMNGRKIRCKACGEKFRIELEDSYIHRGVESDMVASRSGTAVASPPKRRTRGRSGRSSGDEARSKRSSSSTRERSSSTRERSSSKRSSSSTRERSSSKRETARVSERKTGKIPRSGKLEKKTGKLPKVEKKTSGKLGEKTTGKFPKKGSFPKKATGKFPKKGSGAFAKKKSGSFSAPKKGSGKLGSGKLGKSGKLGAKRGSARLRNAPAPKMPGLILPALECLIGLGAGGALYFGATQATAGPLFDAGQQVGVNGALGIGGGLFGVGALWLLITLKKRSNVRAAIAAAAAMADDED